MDWSKFYVGKSGVSNKEIIKRYKRAVLSITIAVLLITLWLILYFLMKG